MTTSLVDIIRSSGHVTWNQAREIAALVESALSAQSAAQQEPVAPTCAVDSVKTHFTPYFLMANARQMVSRGYAKKKNWVIAMDLFAVGSTSAWRICKEAGIDPDGVTVTLQRPVSPLSTPPGKKP